jgi:predicted nucleic acid-binding Zn ribbon protein
MHDHEAPPGTAVPLGSLLQDLHRQLRQVPGAQRLLRIAALWPQVAGADLCANSRPSALHGDRLVVHVTSPVWLQEVRFHQAELRQRLNDALGTEPVAEIRFRIGPITPSRSLAPPC